MKKIKQKYVDYALSNLENTNATVFYSGTAHKYHLTIKGKDERILIITDLFIMYYSKKGDEPKDINYWYEFKDATIQRKGQVTYYLLTFAEEEIMEFECEPQYPIEQIIIEIISHIRTPKEIEKMKNINERITYSFRQRAVFTRVLSQVSTLKIQLDQQIKPTIRYLCRTNSKVLSFTPEMVGRCFPLLLQSYILGDYIESIRIPKITLNEVYAVLSKFFVDKVSALSSIRHFRIDKQNNNSFNAFCTNLATQDNLFKTLRGLTFANSGFNQSMLKYLSDAIFSQKKNSNEDTCIIDSIGFEDASPSEVNFLDSFFPMDLVSIKLSNSNLRLFSLSRMPHVSVTAFVNKMSGIRVLTISYMNLDIKTIIDAISNTNMADLAYLDISGNFAKESNCNVGKLPSTLQRLDANNTNFLVSEKIDKKTNKKMIVSEPLVNFFISVLMRQWKFLFAFSISHINLFSDDNNYSEFTSVFDDLFSALAAVKAEYCCILSHLSFSENYINNDFITFLSKCTSLKSLFFNESLAIKLDCIEAFSQMISKMKLPALQRLSLRGNLELKRCLYQSFVPLCKALRQSRSLEKLDVSNNNIGDEGIDELCEFFTTPHDDDDEDQNEHAGDLRNHNKKLTELSFDNCYVQNMEPLIKLVDRGLSTGRTILLDYPTQEVYRLKTTQIATKEQIISLRRKSELLYKGESTLRDVNYDDTQFNEEQKVILEKVLSYWNKPFAEYKSYITDEFPLYMTQELLQAIDAPERPTITPKNESEEETDNEKKNVSKKRKNDDYSDSSSEPKRKKSKKHVSDSDSYEPEPKHKKSKKRSHSDDDLKPLPKRIREIEVTSSDDSYDDRKRKKSKKSRKKYSTDDDDYRPKQSQKYKLRDDFSDRRKSSKKRIEISDDDSDDRQFSKKSKADRNNKAWTFKLESNEKDEKEKLNDLIARFSFENLNAGIISEE